MATGIFLVYFELIFYLWCKIESWVHFWMWLYIFPNICIEVTILLMFYSKLIYQWCVVLLLGSQFCSTYLCPFLFYFFNFLFLLYFTLQYCIGFAIHWHESAMVVHELPFLNPPPTSHPCHLSGSSPCTNPKHPVSCIEHRLAIHFLHDIIHVSMPFSQIIPLSPFPSESKSLFYTSLSLLLSCIQGCPYHLSKFHIYVLVYSIGVFLSGLLNRLQFHPSH